MELSLNFISKYSFDNYFKRTKRLDIDFIGSCVISHFKGGIIEKTLINVQYIF